MRNWGPVAQTEDGRVWVAHEDDGYEHKPQVATATPTPVNTPQAATATPTPTNTQQAATATRTPTNTPQAATATRTPTPAGDQQGQH